MPSGGPDSDTAEWRTAISELRDDVPFLHGYDLSEAAAQGVGADTAMETTAAAVVDRCLERYGFVPGYGHPMHTGGDPRAPLLLDLARRHGVAGTYVSLAEAGAAELERRRGRPIPLNATGAIAAVLNDLGVPWQFGRGLLGAARSATVSALALEEVRRERRWRMVASGPDVAYDGPPPRPLPEQWRS